MKIEENVDIEHESDLNNIFSKGREVATSPLGVHCDVLAKSIGFELWDRTGEGYVYFENAKRIINLAKPFLLAGDKDGWLGLCAAVTVRPVRASLDGYMATWRVAHPEIPASAFPPF